MKMIIALAAAGEILLAIGLAGNLTPVTAFLFAADIIALLITAHIANKLHE